MYSEHFNLSKRPFAIAPDPGFLVWATQHRQVFDALCSQFGKGTSVSLLIGEIGCGKTLLLHALRKKLDAEGKTTVIFVPSQVNTAQEALQHMRRGLGGAKSPDAQGIRADLAALSGAGRKTVILVDEAQSLSPEAAEAFLSFCTGPQAVAGCRVVLAGHAGVSTLLACPALEGLASGIGAPLRLGPLARAETGPYISERLKAAGYSGPALFSEAAVEVIHTHAKGTPRLINKACDLILLTAAQDGLHAVDAPYAREVLRDFALPGGALTFPGEGALREGRKADTSTRTDPQRPRTVQGKSEIAVSATQGMRLERALIETVKPAPGERSAPPPAKPNPETPRVQEAALPVPPQVPANRGRAALFAGLFAAGAGVGALGVFFAAPHLITPQQTDPGATATPAVVELAALSEENVGVGDLSLAVSDPMAVLDAAQAEAQAELLAALRADTAAAQQAFDELASRLEDGQAELAALTSETELAVEAQRAAETDTEALHRQAQEFAAAIAARESALAELEDRAQRAQSELSELSAASDLAEEARGGAQAEMDALRRQAQELAAAIAAREAALGELEDRAQRAQSELSELSAASDLAEKARGGAQAEMDALRRQTQELAAAIAARETRLSSLEGQTERAQAELAALTVSRKLSSDALAAAETLSARQDAPDAVVLPPLSPVVLGPENGAAFFFAALEATEPEAIAANYARAALRGHSRAASFLAQLFETGDGLVFAPGVAARWYAVAEDPAALSDPARLPETTGTGPQVARPVSGAADGAVAEFVWQGSAPAFTLELADGEGRALARTTTALTAIAVTLPEGAAQWRVATSNGAAFDWQAIAGLGG